MKHITAALFICIISFHATSQSLVAFSSGIATDLNNEKPFYSIPVSLHWEPLRRSAFFIEATKGFGFNRLAKVDAYTTNEQLPEHVNLTEAIHVKSFSVSIGGAIKLYTTKKNNRFALNLLMGIRGENFLVNYRKYDKVHYEVVNPDVSEERAGVFLGAAGVYNFHKRKQDMFVKISVESATTGGMLNRYPLSYKNTAPLRLTYGYKLFYSEKLVKNKQ